MMGTGFGKPRTSKARKYTMINHYMEFGGGLGDIFFQMYFEGAYRALDYLDEQDRVLIALITHNPYAREIFVNHPKAAQIDVRDVGYWIPSEDAKMRAQHGLPALRSIFPVTGDSVRFYPSVQDLETLREVTRRKVVVFAASAGLPDRNLPERVIYGVAEQAQRRGFLPVFVGRTYARHGRTEYRPTRGEGLDLVDALSVPGVASLLQSALGLVACHSAVSMLGCLTRKPQLLLYPHSVYERHIVAHDHWAFGTDFPECRHAQFGDPNIEALAASFFDNLRGDNVQESQVPAASVHGRIVQLPAESQKINVDETIPRLTSAREVKFLCWLAQGTEGNVVEIGCNKGLTTRDLALTNPTKFVYAVDYFVRRQDHDWQICERPSAEELCVYARHLRNVVVLHADSAQLNYEALVDVDLIFIDGDHTFEGVRADTECALRFLSERGHGTVVWHDYYETGPDWVGVKRYVDSLDLEIVRVDGTWIALTRLGKREVRDALDSLRALK